MRSLEHLCLPCKPCNTTQRSYQAGRPDLALMLMAGQEILLVLGSRDSLQHLVLPCALRAQEALTDSKV